MSENSKNILDKRMNEFLERLKDLDLIKVSKLIDDEYSYESLSQEIIIKLMVKPQLLSVEDDELIVFIDGEKHKITINTDIIKGRNKLSLVLPDIDFDIDQDGNVARQVEVESIYKVSIVSAIFNDLYKSEIDEILSDYDYGKMCTSDENYPFSRLRKEVEEEASYIMKMLLAACTIKLSNFASKNTSKILSLLTQEERSELENLTIKTKSILFKAQEQIDAETDPLNKKTLIYAKDKLIAKTIDNSNIGKVFRIVNLSSEAIPSEERVSISREARKFAKKLAAEQDLLTDDKRNILQNYLFSRLRRRGWKQFVSEMKQTEYLKYKEDTTAYKPRTKR